MQHFSTNSFCDDLLRRPPRYSYRITVRIKNGRREEGKINLDYSLALCVVKFKKGWA
jgi:hypothetical protein